MKDPREIIDHLSPIDAPIIFAEAVVDAWKAGGPSRADVVAVKVFIEDELGGWRPSRV